MSLANSNGPRWIRKQKAASDRSLAGVGPIRRFLAALLGRSGPPAVWMHERTAEPGSRDIRAS